MTGDIDKIAQLTPARSALSHLVAEHRNLPNGRFNYYRHNCDAQTAAGYYEDLDEFPSALEVLGHHQRRTVPRYPHSDADHGPIAE